MLTEQTLQQLQSLNLLEMARKWQEQQRDPQMAELSFDERFGLLVDSQSLSQHNKRIRTATFRGQAPAAASLRRGRRLSEEPRAGQAPVATARHLSLHRGPPRHSGRRSHRHWQDLRLVRARTGTPFAKGTGSPTTAPAACSTNWRSLGPTAATPNCCAVWPASTC